MLLFASDTKSCRQACEKAKPLCKNGCFRRSCIDIAFSDLPCFLGVWCGAVFVVGWFWFFLFLFCPPSNEILQQRRFFFSTSWRKWKIKRISPILLVVLSPLLLHVSCGPNSISTYCITFLFLRLMILLSCLWLIMPWIFITGSAFRNCCCLECFQLEPSCLVLQFATVPVKAAAVQQQMIWKCRWFVSALVTPLGAQERIRWCGCDNTGSLLQLRCVSGFGLSLWGLWMLNAGSRDQQERKWCWRCSLHTARFERFEFFST